MKNSVLLILAASMVSTAYAKVDLSTLPERESRPLTLKKGMNKLQFSWANTLIDPTSLEILPKAHAGDIDIMELTYPPRVRNLGLRSIRSKVSGKVPVEITYLTSGLTWRAFYMGTLTEDEKTMRLQGYVRVTNRSGEDYGNAQTRLIVGKVHILDEIAALARREHPYGSPIAPPPPPPTAQPQSRARYRSLSAARAPMKKLAMELAPKEVKKEGLSEYFLYTIAGTETIPKGWSKRLPSFDVDEVKVINLYKYEEERYGRNVVRFLSFKNDEDHNLGETPIPGGLLKVYRGVDDEQHLAYTGQSSFKYIPVDEDVELNLGAVSDVVVEPKLMAYETQNYKFDRRRNISGWDEVRIFKIEVRNTRDIPVKLEIKRNFPTSYWDLENSGDFGEYEKDDLNTVKYTILLDPHTKKEFQYVLRTYHGTREEAWRK